MSKPPPLPDIPNRDQAAKLLPGFLLDAILPDGGFGNLVAESYRPPTNKAEAEVHSELLGQGHLVLRKGWPDLCVITRKDMFCVEVKHADWLSPSQKVVTEMLARAGIDTYIASKRYGSDRFVYEAVGDSKHWTER